ncbi:MAG: TraR/DksA C4-type zinc finger protein [Chloroflexi bacterium]|nr:TraR/DksA C4-type zinc finger protein [Chloroflexota bacterium]
MPQQTAKNSKHSKPVPAKSGRAKAPGVSAKTGNGAARSGNGNGAARAAALKADSKTDGKKQKRERLNEERAEAELELGRLRGQMQIEIEHDSDEGDPDVYEREKLLAVIRTLEDKVGSIDDAMKALDQGHYGVCERCGAEIGAERLRALPGTTLCVKCKAETEKMLKRGFVPE